MWVPLSKQLKKVRRPQTAPADTMHGGLARRTVRARVPTDSERTHAVLTLLRATAGHGFICVIGFQTVLWAIMGSAVLGSECPSAEVMGNTVITFVTGKVLAWFLWFVTSGLTFAYFWNKQSKLEDKQRLTQLAKEGRASEWAPPGEEQTPELGDGAEATTTTNPVVSAKAKASGFLSSIRR